MSRYTGPSCRLCRRENTKLFLKGERCYSRDKCPVDKHPGAPGQHGTGRKKVAEYGMQLREKQKAKRFYGLHETQFKNTFRKATKMEGLPGQNLLILLERRLDNTVYKMGMAESRKEARQLVTHGHFRINGRKAAIPSMLVKEGDVVSLKSTSRSLPKIKSLIETLDNRKPGDWLEMDTENISARITRLPKREDVDFPFEEHLIVELYSK